MTAEPWRNHADIGPGLWLVATPIGSARDITLRALDVLAGADVLAAEDTRTLRHLMEIHGVALNGRQVIAYHDHNGKAARPRLLAALRDGKSVAYASEAGTPMIADPGFVLAREAIALGYPVTTAPGASAVITALTVGGLPTDRFLFAGFSPSRSAERQGFLQSVLTAQATVVLYESPKRVHELLDDLVQVGAGDRQIAICRELTKRFEEVLRGTARELIVDLAGRALKGEVVVLIDRGDPKADAADMETALREALKTMSVKDAADVVSTATGMARRQVYQAALAMGKVK